MFSRKAVADQLRSLICVLLAAAVIAFVWGSVVYFSGATASITKAYPPRSGSNIDTAAQALRFSAIGLAFGIPLVSLNYAVMAQDRHSRSTNNQLVVWAWVFALAPLVAAAVAFGGLNFVRPDLVDEESAPGYLLMCIAAFLMVGVAATATITHWIGGSLLRKPDGVAVIGSVGWTVVVAALVAGTMAVTPALVPMRDEFQPGPVAATTTGIPVLDMSRLQIVDPENSVDHLQVTAVGLVGVSDGSLETVDPFTGETRWMVRKSGAPDGPDEIRVVGDGAVVLVRWRNLGADTYAYAADTGTLLWQSDEFGQDGEWEELSYHDGDWTVRDPRSGGIQTVISYRTTCSGVNARLRGTMVLAVCVPRDGEGRVVADGHSTVIALDRSTGEEVWRSDYVGYAAVGTETFDIEHACPKYSLELGTGVRLGSKPCSNVASRYTEAGSYLEKEDDSRNMSSPFQVVDRDGRLGSRVDLGSRVFVFDPAGGTREHTFVYAHADPEAWLVAVDNATGAVDVLMGATAMPDGAEPRVRAVITEKRGLSPTEEVAVVVTPWGVVIGEGHRSDEGFGGSIRPQIVIPAARVR